MFKNWSTKRVQMAVVAGLLLGVTTPIAAMMMRSHHSEAAVAVIDEKNIAEESAEHPQREYISDSDPHERDRLDRGCDERQTDHR